MPSFDIVSKTDVHEVDNALAGVMREIGQRFDFKGSKCSAARNDNEITVLADDELKLKQMQELIKGYMTRRKLDPSCLDFKPAEKASGQAMRQTVLIRQGIGADVSKPIVKEIKNSKLKVQAAIQGDELRVTGKKIDDLQEAIALVKGLKIAQPLQFVNFRS
ncbi:MAG: YajQ family cyclic di-GMP-binding protein [Alphaproteobacteria bacterium]